MDAVAVINLEKSYGSVHAVKGISFAMPEGSFFALLGPNGSGKSTTISILCGIVSPDSGAAEIFGTDVSDPSVKKHIGAVFQESLLDDRLTVRENLELRGAMYGISDEKNAATNAIQITGCEEFADSKYGTLSGGQRRRADIARALIHGPRVLILDEPSSGLDPRARKMIWDTVSKLRSEGMTVLLTTHYMEEAAEADRIIIIKHGEIVAEGSPEEIRNTHGRNRMTVVPKNEDSFRRVLESGSVPFSVDRGVFTVPLKNTAEAVPLIRKAGDEIVSFEVRAGTLDEAFIEIAEDDS